MEISILKELLVILGLSIAILLIGHRLSIPPVFSLITTGVLVGPHGLQLVNEVHDVDLLAEMGIVLLLFSIGMEFSLNRIIQIKRLFFLGGSLQVGLTILAGFLGGLLLGRSWSESFLLGCLFSMSSTAIVLRMLEQKGETSSPQGQLSISILVFQDMIAIPMILFIPLLGLKEGAEAPTEIASFGLIIKGLIILAVVFFSAQRLVPRLLLLVARTRNKELFLFSVLALCFGVASLTSSLGLSLTIGAFLAGVIISESEYSNEAVSHIFPFQALFISLFFISTGMLLDINFILARPFLIMGLALGILLIKAGIAGVATLLLGMPIRTAVLVGIALSQIGEFSFVLAKTGIAHGLGSDYDYQLFLAVAAMTLAISPVLMNFAPAIANRIFSMPLPKWLKAGLHANLNESGPTLQNHIIIIGFGVSGKNLARSSKLAEIPYTIIEMNPDTVKEQKRLGEPIHFGDASHIPILEHAHIATAKTLAILINDPLATRRIVKTARELNPNLYIIARVRYMQEMSLMSHLGADEVIPDEFGTSIEIFSHVLRQYHIPQDEINRFVTDIRADSYEILRDRYAVSTKLYEMKMNLSNIEISSFRLHKSSSLTGKSLAEVKLRKDYGMTVLLVRRDSTILPNPSPDMTLLANDILVVVAEKICPKQAKALFGEVESSVLAAS